MYFISEMLAVLVLAAIVFVALFIPFAAFFSAYKVGQNWLGRNPEFLTAADKAARNVFARFLGATRRVSQSVRQVGLIAWPK
jgi:ABC-type dipeptide/oligopeptide/nickel transport system permease subunit